MRETKERLNLKLVNPEYLAEESDGPVIEVWNDFTKLPYIVRKSISQSVIPLTGKGFMRIDLKDEQLRQDVEAHVVNASRFVLVTNPMNQKPIAFVASEMLNIIGMNFYHLGGIIIDPDFQGGGLGKKLLEEELERTQPEGIILRTQSTKMFNLAARISKLNHDLALKIAPFVYPNNLDGNVNHGVYRDGHSLYEKEEEFEPYAIDTIDWRSGDALVVAGYVKKD